MNRQRKRRTWRIETHKLRVLRTVAARQDQGDPIPDTNWFPVRAKRTVKKLLAEHLLTDGGDVRLTVAGRRFIAQRIHPAQGKRQKPDIRADEKTQHKPQHPHDGTFRQTPQPSPGQYRKPELVWRCHSAFHRYIHKINFDKLIEDAARNR
jgi:hypothetical protein